MNDWPEDYPIPLAHLLVPEAVRKAVKKIIQAGDELYRITIDQGLERWLLDGDGELIEVFWRE